MFLFPILIIPFLLLNVDSAVGKKKGEHIPWKEPTNCASVIGIREKQGPDFASKFYFDKREANRIKNCLNKRKEKQEIYYIIRE